MEGGAVLQLLSNIESAGLDGRVTLRGTQIPASG